jgi:hypothetical protein
MLVIGFQSDDNSVVSHELDVDPDIDSPRKIHDLLKKKAHGQDFSSIVCVQDDAVIASFVDSEDYDLSEPAEEDDTSEDEEDSDPDGLHETDEDVEEDEDE